MTRNCSDSLNDMIGGLFEKTLVEKPCKIIKVYSAYLVDIEYYDNNKAEVLYKVPVKHLQTSNAYVFLGLKAGDRGTVRFFDNDISEYVYGFENASSEIRKHDINDNLFSPGFYPLREQYILPEGDIVIGQ